MPDFTQLENRSPKKQREYFESVRDEFSSEPVSASAKNVERIDGLIFPRKRYKHHGICIGHEGDRVDVVEYTGPSSTITGSSRVSCSDLGALGIIKKKTYTYEELEKQEVIKMTWPRFLVRYSVDEVIERAKRRLGEQMYGVLENNCEHFVSWCMCGLNVSLQVKEWYSWAKETLSSVCATGKHRIVERTPEYVAKLLANISDELAGKLGKNAGKIGFAFGIVIEVLWAIYEVCKARKRWDEKTCTYEELKVKVVEVLAKGSCRSAGGIVGSLIGTSLGPVGSLVGGAIGAGVGHYVGFCISWCYKNREWLDG